MRNDLFYKQVKENALNKPVVNLFEKYAKQHSDFQVFIITSPLGERYTYQYEENALIALIPNHKLIFTQVSDLEFKPFEHTL